MPGTRDRFERVLGRGQTDELRFLAQGDRVTTLAKKFTCLSASALRAAASVISG
jgi:hypothetical protein